MKKKTKKDGKKNEEEDEIQPEKKKIEKKGRKKNKSQYFQNAQRIARELHTGDSYQRTKSRGGFIGPPLSLGKREQLRITAPSRNPDAVSEKFARQWVICCYFLAFAFQ